MRPQPNTPMEFSPLHSGKWSATKQTPAGPVTAVGTTIGEAKQALDELIVIARAVEFTRRKIDH